MALYASLGFEVTDPVALMSGRPRSAPPAGYAVRPLTHGDLEAAAAVSLEVHGYERIGELSDALASRGGESYVALRDGGLHVGRPGHHGRRRREVVLHRPVRVGDGRQRDRRRRGLHDVLHRR
ncbi:MAG: hypothetical protein ACRDK0_00795 [Solirubrobacteraceae bacterium]